MRNSMIFSVLLVAATSVLCAAPYFAQTPPIPVKSPRPLDFEYCVPVSLASAVPGSVPVNVTDAFQNAIGTQTVPLGESILITDVVITNTTNTAQSGGPESSAALWVYRVPKPGMGSQTHELQTILATQSGRSASHSFESGIRFTSGEGIVLTIALTAPMDSLVVTLRGRRQQET